MAQKKASTESSALFIMPRSSRAWRGAEALWITVAGWAAAAQRRWYHSVVITTDKIATADEVIYYPLSPSSKASGSSKPKAGWLPVFVKTGLKDIILWKNIRAFRNRDLAEIVKGKDIKLVWEQHDLFAGPGRKLARQLNVPFVCYVHAPQVWEASRWGVKRPFWGTMLEKWSEGKNLRDADLVACVSEDVANKVMELGVPKDKVIISPMAVDPHLFSSPHDREKVRRELGIENKVVVGWTGSFRSFHGMDMLIDVFNRSLQDNPNIVLVLVGDGAERSAVEKQVADLGIKNSVLFTGKKQFADIPKMISAFDVAIVSARSAENFHYSPLKLREYLAAGKATLAPMAGEIPAAFEDGRHLLLYRVGDIEDSAAKLSKLVGDLQLRNDIGEQGKIKVMQHATWDYELEKVLKKLNVRN